MAKKTIITLDNLNQYNTLSKKYIADKIDEKKITKTSELTNDSNFAKTNENNNFSASQTITGNLTVTGSITQQGQSYETHAEKVYTKDDFIILRDGATSGLVDKQYVGFKAKLYNGTNDGELVFDNQGTARVGDVGDEQPLLTRSEEVNLTNGQVFVWDAANHKAIGSSDYTTKTYVDGLVGDIESLLEAI